MEGDSGIFMEEICGNDMQNLGGGAGVEACDSRYSGWWSGSDGGGGNGNGVGGSDVFF